MRILIIGGTGFSGPIIVRRLNEMGYEIALFNRGQTQADMPADIRQIHGDRKDITEFAGELKKFAPDIVLDMICSVEQDAQNVTDVFKGVAGRIIALSSQDVYLAYGRIIGTEPGNLEHVPLNEKSPLRTKLFPYRDKAAGPDDWSYHYEKILVEKTYMSNPELPGTILRLPMLYGPRDSRHHRLFEYLKRMDDNRPAIILEQDLAGWRWTKGYIENVAEAIVLAVTDDRAKYKIYNVGETETLTETEWVKAIGWAAGWNGHVVAVSKEKIREYLIPDYNTAQHLVTDSSLIRKELGYREAVSFDEGLRRTIEWERAHPPQKIDPALFDYAAEDAVLAGMQE